jgi:hypothetical protein
MWEISLTRDWRGLSKRVANTMIRVTQEVAGSESKQHSVTIGQRPDLQDGSPLVTVGRGVFEPVGPFEVKLSACEDYDLYLRKSRRFPVKRYNEEVADYRQHGTNMSHYPALMSASSLTVPHRQWKFAKDYKGYCKSYKIGVGTWSRWYGEPLVSAVRVHMRDGQWGREFEACRC